MTNYEILSIVLYKNICMFYWFFLSEHKIYIICSVQDTLEMMPFDKIFMLLGEMYRMWTNDDRNGAFWRNSFTYTLGVCVFGLHD